MGRREQQNAIEFELQNAGERAMQRLVCRNFHGKRAAPLPRKEDVAISSLVTRSSASLPSWIPVARLQISRADNDS